MGWGGGGGRKVRVRAYNLYPVYVQYSLRGSFRAKGEVLRMGREMPPLSFVCNPRKIC